VALIGPSGTGKTTAVRTLIDQGITPFIIFTEDSRAMLGDIPKDKCHWHYIAPSASSWSSLIDTANKVNTLPFDALTKLKDINKKGFKQMIEVYQTCNEFICDRTGENFGDIADFGTDRAVVVDSLSGLSKMAMALVVGSKPVRSMPDWGIAMNTVEDCVVKLCTGLECHFVMTAHIERELDEVTGGVKLMMSTLGKKLPALLPRFFDEVILTKHTGSDFLWSTSESNIDLTTRFLEHSNQLPPSFKTMIDVWKTKGGKIVPHVNDETDNVIKAPTQTTVK